MDISIRREEGEFPTVEVLNAELPVWRTPLCAWCLSEQGVPAGEGSHGICREHANKLLLQQRKLVEARKGATS